VRLAAGPGDGPEIRGPLVVADRGFNLHARTCAGALDEAGRLALLGIEKIPRDLIHPDPVGVAGDSGDLDLPAHDVDQEEYVVPDQSSP
jgi:hypothetical protein